MVQNWDGLWGSTKANGRKPKTGLGQVFNFTLGCFCYEATAWHEQARPHLELKTQPCFCPVSLSLSIGQWQYLSGARDYWSNNFYPNIHFTYYTSVYYTFTDIYQITSKWCPWLLIYNFCPDKAKCNRIILLITTWYLPVRQEPTWVKFHSYLRILDLYLILLNFWSSFSSYFCKIGRFKAAEKNMLRSEKA